MAPTTKAFYAKILHCLGNPSSDGDRAMAFYDQGILLIREGYVVACGNEKDVKVPENAERFDFRDRLIVPGFIDTHVHYPQVDIIASYGEQLLDWLNKYTFPEEARFKDFGIAKDAARFFLDELLRNGTTTALVFGTVHKESVTAFFEEAQSRKLRMLCGKVMMDRNAPDELLDTAESSFEDSQALIDRWHLQDRLGYAVTPRFAPTSTPEQLVAARRLLDLNPGVHLHTHMAENIDECHWVEELFPGSEDYLAVYERFGLVRKRSVFAHAIHLPDNAWQRLASADAAVSHCPCSNLFIGSGLFNLKQAQLHRAKVGIGTDIGGGDNFSILKSLNEAYKIQQLQNNSLTPEYAFYLATLGGAEALDMQQHIGNFEPGKEADFNVINESAIRIMQRKNAKLSDWRERLFTLLMLGDERCIEQTWIMGEHYQVN